MSGVTIAFAGDVHFEGVLRSRLDDPATALTPLADRLGAAGLTVVNLETSIGDGGRPEPKRFTFQAGPRALAALASAGVDVATMANNHAVDFGPPGLRQTLAAVERSAADPARPLSVVGIGADADAAYAPAIHRVGTTTVAVLGASDADADPSADPTARWAARAERAGIALADNRLVGAVESVRPRVDVVVVYLHWGVQGERCPTGRQRWLARSLVDAGADVVVGSHAHRVQSAGWLRGERRRGFVAYGLGNFLWYTNRSDASDTGLLTLTIEPVPGEPGATVTDASWDPATIGADGLPAFTAPPPDRSLPAPAGCGRVGGGK